MSRLKELLRCAPPSTCNTQQQGVQPCTGIAQHAHSAQQELLHSARVRGCNTEQHAIPITRADATLASGDEGVIRGWLVQIKETDPAIIRHVLHQCRIDADARDYFMHQCREAQGATLDPAAERRRQKVLAMLNAGPNVRYAVAVTDPDSDPVIVAIGIKRSGTSEIGELEIPCLAYNPVTLLELLDQHSESAL
jgi:hypothetical protein